MAGISNGLALYGFKPFCSTFLAFSDYMKSAIRMSAIMNQNVQYIFTNDGDDKVEIKNSESFKGNILTGRGDDKVIIEKLVGPSLDRFDRESVDNFKSKFLKPNQASGK